MVRERPDLAKTLIKLRLAYQAEFDKIFKTAVKALSATRKRLAIETGNTHQRHGSVSTWISSKEIHGY